MIVSDIVQSVFSIPPKPPLSFDLQLDTPPNVTLFQVLMSIFVQGARMLYGSDLTINNITSQQFQTLNECMESMGYTVKYEYLYEDEEKTKVKGVNIWFVHYIRNLNCHLIRATF